MFPNRCYLYTSLRAEVSLLPSRLLAFTKSFASLFSCIFGLLTTRLTSDANDLVRDCSLFMPKGGGAVFRVGGGVKFSKSIKKGGVFLKYK